MTSYLEEHFPHVIPGLTENWGKPEALKAFLFSLIFDSRGGRSGWPREAWEELSFLEALHKLVHEPAVQDEADPLDDSIKWVS